jgi:uroporphyrinogen-III synthase
VYHTIIAAHKISKDYDGILFYSPSAVESFFLVNTINENAVLFAIGYTTSNALKKFIKNKIIIAEQPGKEALVKKMVEYFSIQKQVN